MDNLTPGQIITALLAAASAVVLLANAAEKIAKAVQAARAPNVLQDQRLDAVERHLEEVDRFLARDKSRLESIEKGNSATQRALLALLDHGIDGNNTKQMQEAKAELQKYLIER